MLQVALNSEAKKFEKIYSHINKYDNAMSTILDAIKFRHLETSGTLILAPSGTGKSRMVEQLLAENAEYSEPEQEHIFGIYIETPDTSLNELYIEILYKLRDVNPEAGTIADKKRRVITLINNIDVKVMFLDEVQVALPSSGLLPTSTFVKQLKELVNKTNCAWVLLGVPEAQAIIDVDTQLADRFPRVIQLENFSLNGEQNVLDFMEYLFDLTVGFPRKLPFFQFLNDSLSDGSIDYKSDVNYDNFFRFCLASLGKPRRIRDLFIYCIESTAPDEKITKSRLADAFDRCYPNCLENKRMNPFNSPIKEVKKTLVERGLYA
jgi:hypothetical protein